jgi:hypothetical protein
MADETNTQKSSSEEDIEFVDTCFRQCHCTTMVDCEYYTVLEAREFINTDWVTEQLHGLQRNTI